MALKLYVDGNGIAAVDHRLLLPARASDFPKRRVVKDPSILAAVAIDWDRCMVCGWSPRSQWRPGWRLHTHHIAHGSCGRSDERTNLARLCSAGPDQGCHAESHGGDISIGHLLWCRWKAEPSTVDWVRLAILFGHFLPDLEP